MKRALKGIVQRVFESLWTIGFQALGRCLSRRPEIWSSPGGRRVLVVAPHPDDEVVGCGGAILAHLRAGDAVRICCVTDGRASQALGLSADEMAHVRRAELEVAVDQLGAELDWLGLPEGEWRRGHLATRLGRVLLRLRPHLVYAPSRVDFHPEHERVARALASALSDLAEEPPEIRIYPVHVPLTPILTRLVVPLSSSEPRLLAALQAHRSQLGSLERCLRHRRYTGRLYDLEAAEELWQMSAAQYQHLHREPPQQPLVDLFRGLRYYAWSDPLAYAKGLGERRRLATLVA
ncbi:MAG: PIG-L family deacetylase [Acidobacteriota bacterium]